MLALVSLPTAGLPKGYPSVPMRGLSGSVDMPLVGLGTWLYNSSVAHGALASALSIGYRHVDTAFGYGNQEGVGAALKSSGLQRDEFFITSKVPGGLNASATTAALDASLVQLGVEQIDLMLLHWPAKARAH